MAEERKSNRAPRAPQPTQRLLTPQQASIETGIPHTSIRDHIARGHLPCCRFPGSRRQWIRRIDLDQFIAQAVERVGA